MMYGRPVAIFMQLPNRIVVPLGTETPVISAIFAHTPNVDVGFITPHISTTAPYCLTINSVNVTPVTGDKLPVIVSSGLTTALLIQPVG
jgi:hypothetical protein